MRRILVASLLLSPMLFTAPVVASQPKADAAASTQSLRVSTGVTPPEVIYSTSVELPTGPLSVAIPSDAKVVHSMTVDEQGKPNDIQVVKSVNPELDANVVKAVRQFRFRPAKLDDQIIPIQVDLEVEVEK